MNQLFCLYCFIYTFSWVLMANLDVISLPRHRLHLTKKFEHVEKASVRLLKHSQTLDMWSSSNECFEMGESF